MHERLSLPNSHLPEVFHEGYDCCFFAHDLCANAIKSGFDQKIFSYDDELEDDDEAGELSDIVQKLNDSGQSARLPKILVSRIFPAVLSDLLHSIFEALEAARKGKLTIALTLLRKPLQDNLMVLESIIQDEAAFAMRLSETPPRFRRGDDLPSHIKRISKVLELIEHSETFDSTYLGQLRYDKTHEDSFDRYCNKATHLITSNHNLTTNPYDLNFIFPSSKSMHAQWYFIFSRLPYILSYTHLMCEYIMEKFALTYPQFQDDMKRRLGARYVLNCLKLSTLNQMPGSDFLSDLAGYFFSWIEEHCTEEGYAEPDLPALIRMADCGAFPGESEESVKARFEAFEQLAKIPLFG